MTDVVATVVATRKSSPRPVGSKLIVTEDGKLEGSVSGGCVDTAEALCKAAKLLGWHTVVADARARFATKERVPSADELLVEWPEEALAQQPPDTATAIFVLTHDDKFDLPMLTAAVKTDAFYIGALGSRRNQERRRELLREAGLTDEELERISGPAGLDIGAETPAE